MNKEKLTLEKLKKIRENGLKIVLIIGFICCALAIVVITVGNAIGVNLDDLSMYFMIPPFIVVVFWMGFTNLYLLDKIREEEQNLQEKEKTIRIAKIKDIAKQGELKKHIILKDKDLQNKILCNNIEKILFKGMVKDTLIVEIHFKNGFCLPVNFEKEKILSILSDNRKSAILEGVIDDISIDNLEETNMRLEITTKGVIVDKKCKDYNLDAWFKLKE